MSRSPRMKDTTDYHHDERRWSELFPPHTALTFAAVWDPVEGMITFSGAHLLDSEDGDRVAIRPLPKDALDNQSQALTIDMLLHMPPSSPDATPDGREHDPWSGAQSTWAYEAQTDSDGVNSQFVPQWLAVPRGMSTGLNSPAFASSAALTLMLPEAENLSMQQRYSNYLWSRGECGGGVGGGPFYPLPAHRGGKSPCEDHVSDEGFFEGRRLPTGSYGSLPVLVNLNMRSHFSVSTTSTSQYVEVDVPASLNLDASTDKYTPFSSKTSSSWDTLRGGADGPLFVNTSCPDRPRRLKKRASPTHSRSNTDPGPASPQSVLSRTQFNHSASACESYAEMHEPRARAWPPRPPTPPPTPSSLPKAIKRKASMARAKVLDRLGMVGKNDEDGWVCVEVEHRVTHRVEHIVV